MESAGTQTKRQCQTWKLVSEMTANEARDYFLKQTSYTTIELPQYFDFETVLQRVAAVMPTDENPGWLRGARRSADVNYVLHDNKDGRLALRPLTLIHPALYVSLVHAITLDDNWCTITKRLRQFRDLSKFHCASMPRVPTTNTPSEAGNSDDDSDQDVYDGPFGSAMSIAWFTEVEQASIEFSLDFNVMLQADIANCFASIYTHSIPWALHGKEKARKLRRSGDLVGNHIDWRIQDIMEGQTNGIPQGSELMNFIAEIVLGYGDFLIAQRLEASGIANYHVIRFRDDYRVFTDTYADAETALQCLYSALRSIRLELNPDKTQIFEDSVSSAIRADKVAWIRGGHEERITAGAETPYNLLVELRNFNESYPNSGMLQRGITALKRHHQKWPRKWRQLGQLVELLTEIGLSNPKVYPVLAPFLGELIKNHEDNYEFIDTIEMIMERLTDTPHSGRMELWLQRIGPFRHQRGEYQERLCRLVANDGDVAIWDNSWINNRKIIKVIEHCELINRDVLDGLPDMLTEDEWGWLVWTTRGYE